MRGTEREKNRRLNTIRESGKAEESKKEKADNGEKNKNRDNSKRKAKLQVQEKKRLLMSLVFLCHYLHYLSATLLQMYA